MTAVRLFLSTIFDSPTYVRDRANLITGFTVGVAGLLLNGAILIFVFPFLLNSDNVGVQSMTDYIEFGQLVGFVMLVGVTMFATVLIPLRLVTVFWEPRTNRYFDQIVLSGISPFRYLIGKATSQNLFLALLLFLLIPYLALSLALGGVNLSFFVTCLFLVWLYCMELAVMTLWLSLYLNEFLAAIIVIIVAIILCSCGCAPMNFQPFVMTPFPAFFNPIYQSSPERFGIVTQDFWVVFGSCLACMTAIIAIACFGIGLGPLYGIIRENSMFGEVVRAGDTKRKRMMRLRYHIQRPSEIAFFYANRSRSFVRNEGFFRWTVSLLIFLLYIGICYWLLAASLARSMKFFTGGNGFYFATEARNMIMTIQAMGLALAAILFSHSKNSIYLRLPYIWGRRVEVARLDTIHFLICAIVSTVAAALFPFALEQYVLGPGGYSLYTGNGTSSNGVHVDYVRAMSEGTVVIAISGIVAYLFQRAVCQTTWMRMSATIIVGALYPLVIGGLPLLISMSILETTTAGRYPYLTSLAPWIVMASPFAVIGHLFEGQLGPPFPPSQASSIPFYAGHLLMFLALLLLIRYNGKQLRKQYLRVTTTENQSHV